MSKTSMVAVKAVGIVMASFLALGVTAGTAEAAHAKAGTVKPLDTGWGPNRK